MRERGQSHIRCDHLDIREFQGRQCRASHPVSPATNLVLNTCTLPRVDSTMKRLTRLRSRSTPLLVMNAFSWFERHNAQYGSCAPGTRYKRRRVLCGTLVGPACEAMYAPVQGPMWVPRVVSILNVPSAVRHILTVSVADKYPPTEVTLAAY